MQLRTFVLKEEPRTARYIRMEMELRIEMFMVSKHMQAPHGLKTVQEKASFLSRF